jgi:hypothetical protein
LPDLVNTLHCIALHHPRIVSFINLAVMLGEIFYYHRMSEGANIYDACLPVPEPSIPYSRIFQLNDRNLVWPVSFGESVLMKSVELSNIADDLDICSFFCTSWNLKGCFLYVGCKQKPSDHSGVSRCHVFIYEFITTTEEVNYLQDLKVGYKPLDMSEFSVNGGLFLFIVGSDKDIHVYETHSGKLFRSSGAESVKATWKPMLGIGDSFCLRLLTENWGDGQQCVSGFADGYLYWYARNSEGVSNVIAETPPSDMEAKAEPDQFWAAVLLDNAVTCITLFGQSRGFELRRRSFFERIGVPVSGSRCGIIVAGLANGSILLLSSNTCANECTVLTGLDESPHGAVMALTTGNVSGE